MPKKNIAIYSVSIIIFLGLASLGGLITQEHMSWYHSLHKPPFNPPNSIFAPVWTILYIMIALTFAKMWITGASKLLWWLFSLQYLLNFLWTLLFFGQEHIVFALIDLSLLVAVLWTWLFVTKSSQIQYFYLFLPYTIWVSFAWVLNLSIFILN